MIVGFRDEWLRAFLVADVRSRNTPPDLDSRLFPRLSAGRAAGLGPRTNLCDKSGMTGNELLRRLRRVARQRGLMCVYEARAGKGGHGRIHLGDRFTTIPALTHELPPGLLSKILRDLGLTRRDLT